MDTLSEILKSVKMRHAAVGTMQLGAPWGLRIDHFDAPTAYGLVGGPPCWLRLPGREPVVLMPGDMALFPRASRYSMSSAPDTPCIDFSAAWFDANQLPSFDPGHEPGSPLKFTWGGDAAVTRLLGMAFGLDAAQRNPLLAPLPELIVLRGGGNGAFPWLQPAITFLSSEHAGAPGFAATARLLAELVFVSMVRSHLVDEPLATRGWLRGLTEPAIARALQMIHAQPGAAWTVASLAKAVGMSRTAFATRFAALVEVSPIGYLTQWRMHLAAERMCDSAPNLSQLGFDLGYASDAAFREAFKRRYGVPPSKYAEARGRVPPARAR